MLDSGCHLLSCQSINTIEARLSSVRPYRGKRREEPKSIPKRAVIRVKVEERRHVCLWVCLCVRAETDRCPASSVNSPLQINVSTFLRNLQAFLKHLKRPIKILSGRGGRGEEGAGRDGGPQHLARVPVACTCDTHVYKSETSHTTSTFRVLVPICTYVRTSGHAQTTLYINTGIHVSAHRPCAETQGAARRTVTALR